MKVKNIILSILTVLVISIFLVSCGVYKAGKAYWSARPTPTPTPSPSPSPSPSASPSPSPFCTDTCTSLGYKCGTYIICNKKVDCGTCDCGYSCSRGRCVEVDVREVAPNGLVAYYKFSENPVPPPATRGSAITNIIINDLSGNGNNGECSTEPCPTWTAEGKIGGAFSYTWVDGEDDNTHFEIPDSPSLTLNSQATVFAWVYFIGSIQDDHKIIDHSGGTTRWNWGLTDDGGHDGQLRFGYNNGGGWEAIYSSTILSANKWHHVAFVRDGNQITFYLDGVPDGTYTLDTSSAINPNGDMWIGEEGKAGATDEGWNGYIDEVAIWNRALSSSAIAEIYRDLYCGEVTLNYYLEPNVMAWDQNTEKIRMETIIPTNVTINYGRTKSYGDSVSDSNFDTVHELTINGLNPGTLYYYQVIIQGIYEGEIYQNSDFTSSFKTADDSETSFSFAFMGDSRGKDGTDGCAEVGTGDGDEAFDRMLNDAVSKGVDFVIIGGDDIQGKGCSQTSDYRLGWKTFHDLASGLRGSLSIPFLSAIGNHELDGNWNYGHQAYQDYWMAPLNGNGASGEWEETSYSWRYGNTLFIFVNTEEAGNEGDITGNQYTWFNNALGQGGYDHKFVIGHKPLVGTSRDDCLLGLNPTRSAMIGDLMYNNGVTATLFAHEHVYSYYPTHNGKMINIISGGAGAPLKDCKSRIKGYCIPQKWHYVLINITDDKMNLTVYDDSGEIIFPISVGEEPSEWIAYNDLSGGSSGPVTSYSSSSSGNLINYNTGEYLAASLSVIGKSGRNLYGALSDPGTDAYDIFNGKINAKDYLLYGEGDHVFTFTDLDLSARYRFIHFGNRDRSTYYNQRYANVIISDVDGFETDSSAGVTISTTTMTGDTARYQVGYNTPYGRVAGWKNINPGPDGDFVITVKGDPANPKHYSNAIMLQKLPPAPP